MAFREIRLQAKRNFRFGARFCSPRLGRFVITKHCSINRCEPRVSQREIRVEFDCLHVKLLGGLVIFQQRIGIAGDLVRAQIKNVRIGISRRFGCSQRFFVIAERCPQGIRDFIGQFSLQSKRINQSAVVTICPSLAVISRIDQLHIHHHAVAFFAHAALENIRHAKFPPDVADILNSGITKPHHGGTTDDSKIFDLRQSCQDVVLDAVRKKCVVFFRTQIFERHYRNAFLLRERSC
ncbi:MAG: hypothetical protein DMF32_03795 [Verrucomicrobia bacterium]|nr:MAG: hypothetical protein DMF32_03795 [Verrucomicrobiota bacterium]